MRRAGERERVILRLAAEAGLRRAEVARVHSRDLVQDLDGWSLIVHGKGGKQRTVPLTPTLAAELRARPRGRYVVVPPEAGRRTVLQAAG